MICRASLRDTCVCTNTEHAAAAYPMLCVMACSDSQASPELEQKAEVGLPWRVHLRLVGLWGHWFCDNKITRPIKTVPLIPEKVLFHALQLSDILIETSACCILPCDVVFWTVLVSSGILGWLKLKLSNCFLPVIIIILEHLIDIYSYMFATLVWVYWLVNGK